VNFGIRSLLKEFIEEFRKDWFSASYNVLAEKIRFYSYFTSLLTDVCVFRSKLCVCNALSNCQIRKHLLSASYTLLRSVSKCLPTFYTSVSLSGRN